MPPGEGVYFNRQDYAGFWRRLWIDAIDLFVVACLWLPIGIVLVVALDYNRLTLRLIFAAGLVLAFLYFVLLKGSRIGTLGYLLAASA
ncbi:MAG TPA: hypothetical protein VMJ34_21710 [Bryobacteraceae bacterium]|nr:hypothetical protein [Bryobacteraceae bacterium]